MKKTCLALAVTSTLLPGLVPVAHAIPAFARKYQISCSTCHAPFPRLKPFGEEFAAAGFRMPDPSQEPPRATIETGDPTLRLNRDFPIALRLDGFVQATEGAPAQTDFGTPWIAKILSGGPIAKGFSYYLYAIFEEGGFRGLEDAFLSWSRPFGAPFDLSVGQFQVSDALFKRELRLERFDYDIYKARVGDVRANLTYDRGIAVGFTLPGDVDSVFQIVNGNGIAEAEEWGGFDNDDHKNLSLRFSRQIGKTARLGVFGYWGREDGATGRTNELFYFGPDLVLDLGQKWQINAQYLERRDDNPFFVEAPWQKVKTRGGFAELHFLPKGADGPWALTALYSRVDSDDDAADAEKVSLTFNRLLARNVRLALEAGKDVERDQVVFSVGLVTAF
jgi:hypothetical protein